MLMTKFYYINPNKMHVLQSLFYLTTALNISGVTIIYHQEQKTTVTTAKRRTLKLSYLCMYTPGQYNGSTNIHTVYTATTQYFM
jgi:hypothetical protein